MSYGFEVKNASGAVIVDSVSQRFGMPATGSVTADADGFAQVVGDLSPFPLIRLDVNKGLGLVPIGGYAGRYWFLNSSGTDYSVANNETRSIGAIKPYGQIPSIGGYGIEVKNEQGETTFNSAAPIVSFRNAFSYTNSSPDLTIAADVTHVFFTCTWAYINPFGLIYCPIVLRNSATNLHIRAAPIYGGGPPQELSNPEATFHILTARIIL